MTETPIETPVPPTAYKPPKAAPNVLRMFADHGWAARMWFLVAVVALAAALPPRGHTQPRSAAPTIDLVSDPSGEVFAMNVQELNQIPTAIAY